MAIPNLTVRSFQVACLCASELRKGPRRQTDRPLPNGGCVANGWVVAELARRLISPCGTRGSGVASFAAAQTTQCASPNLKSTKNANAARECDGWSNALPTRTSTACTAP